MTEREARRSADEGRTGHCGQLRLEVVATSRVEVEWEGISDLLAAFEMGIVVAAVVAGSVAVAL